MESITVTGLRAVLLPAAVIALLLVVCVTCLWAMLLREQLQSKVDPWEMQRELMVKSGQPRPNGGPVITNNSLMYAGLQAEELAESFKALAAQVSHYYQDIDNDRATVPLILRAVADDLDEARRRLKELLPRVEVFVPLTHAQAKDIFDGAIDVNVVTCGFALASGLPGPQGYREVVGSNLSKANPETGVIDKQPDGKWIKGADYREPDLVAVLDEYYDAPLANGGPAYWEH